jgi:hypothetical protein
LLVEQAAKLLEIDVAIVREALERLLLDGELVYEPIGGQDLTIAVRNDRAAERFSGLYDRLVTSQIDPSGRSYHNCYNTGT